MASSRSVSVALGAALSLTLAASAYSAGTNPTTSTQPIASRDTTPTVIHAARFDVSAPIRDIIRNMPPAQPLGTEEEPYAIPNILLKLTGAPNKPSLRGIQRSPSGIPAPPIELTFETISSATSGCGCLPPDTNGDVSDQHYIQWVNSAWQVFDKTTGAPDPATPSPTQGNSFWVGFGGLCETTNAGDPIALWDPRAQRWVMSQFVTQSPFAQCVAVSTTSDPLGTYNRYEFNWTNFGDYPKLAVWTDESGSQDAYLLTTHEFNSSNSFVGAAYVAMERDKMLVGDSSAAMLHYPGFNAYGVEPVNLVGTLNAPANACPSFVHYDDTNFDGYLFWDLCLDWATPANSTISATPTHIAGTPFAPYGGEVPQQGSANGLDSFGTHIMYRANARAFPPGAPTNISLVVNHAVMADQGQSAINWVLFNLDDHGANPPQPTALDKTLVEESTYAPDAENRWMGGIGIDASGNIGLGFSKSSSDLHPQIEITGRTLEDAPGTLRDETNCTEGIANGSQTSSSNRWGDYSSMSVDPVDQCTFYFTDEYYPTTASSSWHTRVCTFKFDGCGDPNYAVVPATTSRVEMCGATSTGDPSYGLRVGVLNGFTGDVALAASGLPAGATAQFSTNPVTAPGSSTLTLVGGAAAASGSYTIQVDGTNGSLTRSVALQFDISSSAPGAPQLTAPVDTASGTNVYPLLTWNAAASDRIFGDGFDGVAFPLSAGDALTYTVDVATDSAFTNIVATTTVATTSWQVDSLLDGSTQYYWRVTPHNLCGDGPVSATFSFTTGVPGVCPAGTTSTTVYQDDFQSGVNGWVAAGSGSTGWTQGTAPGGTGMSTTVWKVPDNTVSSDRTLTTPVIAIPVGAAAVFASYDGYHKSEQNGPGACWDASVLEASNNGTTFAYLDATHMLTDPYNGAGSNDTVLGTKMGWCYPGPAGSSVPTHSVVDMNTFAGQNLQLRFRMVSDGNSAATAPNGFVIDNFKVDVCQ
ncbi:MAG: hypothetical protein ABI843_01860 [Dokdonella sp.]